MIQIYTEVLSRLGAVTGTIFKLNTWVEESTNPAESHNRYYMYTQEVRGKTIECWAPYSMLGYVPRRKKENR